MIDVTAGDSYVNLIQLIYSQNKPRINNCYIPPLLSARADCGAFFFQDLSSNNTNTPRTCYTVMSFSFPTPTLPNSHQ
ncbi:hypothetical protein TL16_g00076 [Triparma laevis f. inornata]|uniref:Uncharacterized protein n=1 Tax=Triparma laevis f. inornata TaxID=1714386 RepID=A0A9W6ZBP5_9STRA|nr:hypothetical protein TL16_g00076 [Triparma laevis f. inornata]